ncbi:neurogenic locus notch homolog protein 2-like [Mya arenaria]|uniref:neurogenic locus notch homolog protein 2-like n=1 Tax=Mya arenaria TaxID=6604 RepID=UPI0022E317AD|nr:neurogenic locus notch homolog protein 2-like [Mya arenaria]
MAWVSIGALIVNVVVVFASDLEVRLATTNACSPNPCVHGSCFTSASDNYTCVCDGDFTGQNCDTPIYALECYNCQNIRTPSACNQTQKCTSRQSCFMEATTTANGVLYRMGCQPSAVSCSYIFL